MIPISADYLSQWPATKTAQGRLWDILNMLRFAIRNDGSTNKVSFSLYVNNSGKPEPAYLKSICGPGDDADPVITIMLPHED